MRKEDVERTLYRALDDAKRPSDGRKNDFIDFVLDNTHLTYKYILITALASKATDPSINPLCLQAGSTLPGAYDARTICHSVIVPFEMTELGKALGGSNEPFLNKPARFPELSKQNAVRRGRDQSILYALCDELPKIRTAEQAYNMLVYAIRKLLAEKARRERLTNFHIMSLNAEAAQLMQYMDRLLEENFEGEVLTLVVAGLYELYMSDVSEDYLVDVHPVNQSGASSKEVSDLDIYRNGSLYIANELKDKPFTDHDLRHAADKVIAAGKSQMHFIYGRHSSYDYNTIAACNREYLSKGFIINVVPVDYFVMTVLNLIDRPSIDKYVKFLLQAAMQTKFKEETIAFVRDTAAEMFGI